VLAEIAIAACDLAEVLGTIIALKLLFGMPMLWGCLVTAFDTFVLLWLQRWGMRTMEAVVLALVATIGACFLIQIFMAHPAPGAVIQGLRPGWARGREVVRGDRHPRGDGDAPQPLPPLGPGADASDRQGRGEQGGGVPL
jgi:Mn2+/Fe2+ NRAMP family transporter